MNNIDHMSRDQLEGTIERMESVIEYLRSQRDELLIALKMMAAEPNQFSARERALETIRRAN